MIKVGLTGNIGSGKSVVSRIFSILGIPVYHADEESKKFLNDPQVKNELLRYFGYSILSISGEINRRSLASHAFTDEHAMHKLNSIMHPLVMHDFHTWTLNQGSFPYIIQEAAIIIESGLRKEFDKIIHVSCLKEIAIGRVVQRDGIDVNSVLRRMQFQMEDKEKAALSDFVIRNDGSELVIPQVLAIHRRLSEGTT
ncbi:MAG: dephospho-CoA kinase [Bacteroidales bacterium]|nr:dephospho-CoA kinase [Bacteroidales bacterium]